ncbi:MAG TPA: hypothetical protein VN518_06435 [Methyloceanibacter sp.]|nr:hypothetical protein [Methyloceanibacter sp.]
MFGRGVLAVSARKGDAVLIDQRETDRWNVEGLFCLFQRERLLDAVDRDGELALELGGVGGTRWRAQQQSGAKHANSRRYSQPTLPISRAR